jgi:hypothetical protein
MNSFELSTGYSMLMNSIHMKTTGATWPLIAK